MASIEQLDLSPPHAPKQHAIEAFEHVLHEIKAAIIASRHDWDKHEPKMWSLASKTSDHDLVNFTIKDDLVVVRSAVTSYGPIILGKIRIRAIELDSSGELVSGKAESGVRDDNLGFIHVRIHDPPGDGVENIKFHSLFTDEGKDKDGNNNGFYRAIQPNSKPLEFFNE
ncbi:hypothetical protein B0H15DRAFT_924623 [Mycena belliarum]|uniref:Uncharacterized protein n=1 Tax=Mycena belliarum TaxID=1033014 RepID=A0AAD6TVJ9_9AGAR|nr:hypothetical protein B0H15DRAFT_924623 [Mycena belliae]